MHKRTIHIFIGEMGVGKSYLAKKFAELNDYPFYEGDDAIPLEMSERVRKWLPLSRDMVRRFVEWNLTDEIKNFIERNPQASNVVVCQALYNDRHRLALFRNLHFWPYWGRTPEFNKIRWYHVKAPFLQHCKQLLSRKNGFRWLIYGLLNKLGFQKPFLHSATVINNVSGANIFEGDRVEDNPESGFFGE